MIEQGIEQLLSTAPTVSSLLGTSPNRVNWVLAPQGTAVPFLVLSSITTTDTNAMAGPTGQRSYLLQVVCYSSTYYQSRKIAKAVRLLLAGNKETPGFKGALPDADATLVQGILCEKDWDMQYESGSKGFIYGAYLQFRVWYYD